MPGHALISNGLRYSVNSSTTPLASRALIMPSPLMSQVGQALAG
jgi:hypothetical protein